MPSRVRISSYYDWWESKGDLYDMNLVRRQPNSPDANPRHRVGSHTFADGRRLTQVMRRSCREQTIGQTAEYLGGFAQDMDFKKTSCGGNGLVAMELGYDH